MDRNTVMSERLSLLRAQGGHRLGNVDKMYEFGQDAISSGWMINVARKLDLPWRYIANCMDVQPPVLRRWLRGEGRINRNSLLKLSVFRVEVDKIIASHDDKFWKSSMPIKNLAMARGVPVPFLEELCQTGHLQCHDLGILGTWATATETEMTRLRRARDAQIKREKDG